MRLTETKQATLGNLINTAIEQYDRHVRELRSGSISQILPADVRERLAQQFELQVKEAKALQTEIAETVIETLHVPQGSKNAFEHAIVRALLRTLASLEWLPSEFDSGEEITPVTDEQTVLDAVFAVDEGILYFENEKKDLRAGVKLMLGNDDDIITDWSNDVPPDLKDALARVMNAAKRGPYTIHVSSRRA